MGSRLLVKYTDRGRLISEQQPISFKGYPQDTYLPTQASNKNSYIFRGPEYYKFLVKSVFSQTKESFRNCLGSRSNCKRYSHVYFKIKRMYLGLILTPNGVKLDTGKFATLQSYGKPYNQNNI